MRRLLSVLIFMLISGCAGLGAHQASPQVLGQPTPECASIEQSYETWSAVELGAGVLVAPTGLSAIPIHNQYAQDALISSTVVLTMVGAVAAFLRDEAIKNYGATCETKTSTKAVAPLRIRVESKPMRAEAPGDTPPCKFIFGREVCQ